jgi:RNA polymerase sigma factor (sigma-70 family)
LGVAVIRGLVADCDSEFERFAAHVGERLRRVLVARHGVDVGSDVTDEALAYAWEHWDRVRVMDNPVGYLYRVAGSATRRHRRWKRHVVLPRESGRVGDSLDPGLHRALEGLSERQRVCVVLVHVYDWTYRQVAEALGISEAAVTNHVHRGLRRLRRVLNGDDHD